MGDAEQLLLTAQQIRLDLVAVRVAKVLAGAEVPHALIKGVTTSRWLYDQPRRYGDVDVLVPQSRVGAASAALTGAGVATATAGLYGEAAAHSQLLITPDGAEVDLHGSLPGLNGWGSREPDRLWSVLASDLTLIELDGVQVTALSLPSRCVVLGLHAVASARGSGQAAEDLRRARAQAGDEVWAEAFRRADLLGLTAHLTAALEAVRCAARCRRWCGCNCRGHRPRRCSSHGSGLPGPCAARGSPSRKRFRPGSSCTTQTPAAVARALGWCLREHGGCCGSRASSAAGQEHVAVTMLVAELPVTVAIAV
jgi:Uncharacterised nucleotidyltransferase